MSEAVMPRADLFQLRGDALRLTMHPGQTKAWKSDKRFVFVLAGTQSGKTSWGPWWLQREIDRTADPAGGSNDYAAVTSSYDLFKLKMLPALRECIEDVLQIGRYWASDRVIELKDPSTGQYWANSSDARMWGRIILRSASSGGGLESMSARAAWLDECGQDEFTVESWEAVLRRLSLSRGRVLGTTTPYNLGWLKGIYDRWAKGQEPDTEFISFPSHWNPSFPRAEYERARDSMPGWRFAMFYNGEFTRPAGIIYEAFDQNLHVEPDPVIPPEWPRWIGMDFGAVHTAVVWLAEDPETHVYHLYRERLAGGLTTAEHVRAIHDLSQNENVAGVWGGAPGEDQQRRDFTAAGLGIRRPGVADVEAGIDRVTALFKQHRLRIARSCTGIISELNSYSRRVDAQGMTQEAIDNKADYHRLDALRYVAVGAATGGGITRAPGIYD